MPFKSKSQQRLMFSKNPEKAREWAHETKDMKSLPEKKHPKVNPKKKKLRGVKIAADGMFFQRNGAPGEGRYFRDQLGRDDGAFLEKQGFGAYPMGETPEGGGMDAGADFGTGAGKPKPKPKLPQKPPVAKTAARTPADEDEDGDLPLGFHRPTESKPEPLETGGERFHSTEADNPSYGVGKGVGSDSRMRVPAMGGHQVGKHASVAPRRFLGTSATITKQADPEGYLSQRAGEFGGSLRSAGHQAANYADEGLQSLTKSPLAAGIAALALGKLGLRGMKGGGRLAGRGLSRGLGKLRRTPPLPPPSPAAAQVGGLARRLRGFITG